MTSADAPQFKTRRPTGKPPWPMVLLAGAEKCGKSYAAAAFSASDLVDRTFFVELGEGYADHYGELPGARYEIVEHDGTYVGLGRALRAATLQPRPNGKPHAIVLDSGTELWDLLSEEAQLAANRRKGKGDDGEAQITMDLWNTAKKRWRHIIDLLRQYDGPVIVTARLESVTVMDQNGKPTAAKEWKVRAEKNLPFECDAVVKMPEQGRAILTGVRSLLLRTGSGLEVADFSVEKLLTSMGIRPGETRGRAYTAPRAEQGTPADMPRHQEPLPPAVHYRHPTHGPMPADEWSTPAPDAAAEPQSGAAEVVEESAQPQEPTPAESPRAKDALLKAVHVELSKRVGNKREDHLAALAAIIGLGTLETSNNLTPEQARGALEYLAGLPLPPQGWTREDADQLAADYVATLRDATTDAERAGIAKQIADAVKAGKIMPHDRRALLEVYNEKPKPQTDPSWSARGMAAMEQQADAMAGAGA